MVWDTQSWCRVYFYATVHPVDTKKKQGVYLMVVGAAVLVGALAFVFVSLDTVPDEEPTATSTPEVATTTDIFDMEPIVPEAKVSTEGWKTCRNEEYGYEFKFPGEWKIYGEDARSEPNPHPISKRVYVRESEECNGASVGLSPTTLDSSGNFEVRVGIEVYTPDRQYPFADLHSLAEQKSRAKQYSMLLDKHDALLQLYVGLYETHWYVTSWRNENVYRLAGENFEDNEPTVITVLSTFRFLDTPSTSPTSEQAR